MLAKFSVLVIILSVTSGYGLIMPMTKPDGSLDVSSLLSHISLLEQTMESKSSVAVTAELQTQLKTALADLAAAQADLRTTRDELGEVKSDLKATKTALVTAQADLRTMGLELSNVKSDLKTNQMELAVLKAAGSQCACNATQTTRAELGEINSDLKTVQSELAVVQSQLKSSNSQCPCNVTQPSSDITTIKTDVSTLKTDVFRIQSVYNSSGGGATFTRWGKTSCPPGNKMIYKGYTGGTDSTDKASSATILCLPEHPIYGTHTNSVHGAYIYGTEYETFSSDSIIKALDDEDMPCVVCESDARRSTIMVPARNQCYPGWNLEYWGYIMGAYHDHASAEYICVDKDPEAVPGGGANKDGQMLYVVEGQCGSLPCPPYVNNWELTCSVCTQ